MPPKRQQTHSSDSVSKRAKTTCTDIVLREEVVAVPGTEGGSCGKGWPFAPEGWPLPGDVWGWRVGRRKSHSGLFWHDRTLYLPERLKGTANPPCFASKVKLEKYLRAHFPTINLSAFFSSFHWRIPCASPEKAFEKQEGNMKGDAEKKKTCKVGNRKCALLTRKKRQYKTMSCEICCTEPGFCGECCCILCGMVTDQGPKEFSSIKCEGKLNDEFICGHVAHLECAVGCRLAGVVTEIGADLEYYCRRCDRKTDLIMHIKGLIKESQYMKSRDSVENYLRLAFHIIQGTERIGGKTVQNAIESTLNKFCNGMELQGIAELEEMIEMLREGKLQDVGKNVECLPEPLNVSPVSCVHSRAGCHDTEDISNGVLDDLSSPGHARELKLEKKITQALASLQRSQEMEYRLARGKLDTQKDLLLSLYKELEEANNAGVSDSSEKIKRLQQELEKFRQMLGISNGFGNASDDILRYFFGARME